MHGSSISPCAEAGAFEAPKADCGMVCACALASSAASRASSSGSSHQAFPKICLPFPPAQQCYIGTAPCPPSQADRLLTPCFFVSSLLLPNVVTFCNDMASLPPRRSSLPPEMGDSVWNSRGCGVSPSATCGLHCGPMLKSTVDTSLWYVSVRDLNQPTSDVRPPITRRQLSTAAWASRELRAVACP